GTTGEALSVSSSERMAALEGLIASGVDPQCIIPGTGLCNLPESIALSRHAVERGCAGVMTLPPFYFKGMGDDGYFDYFEKLIDGVDHPDLKIYLYHIPQVSGVGLSIDLVTRLRTAYPDVIVGIKDSSGDWDNTRRLLAIDGLIVYPGAELPVIDAIRLGGPGCISATANLNGGDIANVIDLCHAGKWDEAEAAHKPVKEVRMLFQDYAPIPAQKALLARRTGEARWNNLRPPFRAMGDDRRDALAASLEPYGMRF
ncbi:MAG: dihydrodipicolinate synthase family protein, partial [Candidatus Puniceispirillaceae bacterium]